MRKFGGKVADFWRGRDCRRRRDGGGRKGGGKGGLRKFR